MAYMALSIEKLRTNGHSLRLSGKALLATTRRCRIAYIFTDLCLH